MDTRNELLEKILQAIQTGGSTDAAIQEVAKGLTGHAFYSSSTGTQASPITITQGSKQSLNFDTVIYEDYLPDGATTFFTGGRFTPQSVGDTYKIGVRFYAEASIGNGGFSASIDISASGDGSNIVGQKPVRMLRGSNSPDYYTIDLNVFTRDVFLANGGLISIEAVDGNISIYDATLFIVKTTAG